MADEGDAADLTRRFGLAFTRAATFAVERRRGWAEAPGTPARSSDDAWDEARADHVVLEKACPADAARVLSVRGRFAAFREGPFRDEARVADYRLTVGDREERLDRVQWADWSADGRLLVATTDGRLQIRDRAGRVPVAPEVDLAPLAPDPQRPPAIGARPGRSRQGDVGAQRQPARPIRRAWVASTWWTWCVVGLEAERGRRHVEPPDARAGPAPASATAASQLRLEVRDPAAQGAGVVLAQALHVADLEPAPTASRDTTAPISCSSPSGNT